MVVFFSWLALLLYFNTPTLFIGKLADFISTLVLVCRYGFPFLRLIIILKKYKKTKKKEKGSKKKRQREREMKFFLLLTDRNGTHVFLLLFCCSQQSSLNTSRTKVDFS